MAILVTGAGYIGGVLLRRLARAAGPTASKVVAFDNFYSTPRSAIEAALPEQVELVEGDVAEPDDIAHAFELLGTSAPDAPITVFHLAAQPSASIAAREPGLTERSNLVGARVVLEAARERGADVVFGGSFRVYGDELAGQCVDERTPYGRVGDLSHLSKIYVEQLARMLGVRFASVRLGITYGLSPIMKTTPAFMTVPNLFCQRAARGEALNVLEDRPMAFIHVEDAATALLAAAAALRSPHPAEQSSRGGLALADAEQRSPTHEPSKRTATQASETSAAQPYESSAAQANQTAAQANETGAAQARQTLPQAAASVFRRFNAAPEVATIGQVARTVQGLMRERGGDASVAGAAATETSSEVRSEASFEVRSKLDFAPRYTLASGLGQVLDYFRASATN